jgi:hypothetical protein
MRKFTGTYWAFVFLAENPGWHSTPEIIAFVQTKTAAISDSFAIGLMAYVEHGFLDNQRPVRNKPHEWRLTAKGKERLDYAQ